MKRRIDKTLLGPQDLSWPSLGEHFEIPPYHGEFEVQKPCRDSGAGHWYCLTHRQHFDNQLQKDIHIKNGTHKMVWCCHRHGLEISNEEYQRVLNPKP